MDLPVTLVVPSIMVVEEVRVDPLEQMNVLEVAQEQMVVLMVEVPVGDKKLMYLVVPAVAAQLEYCGLELLVNSHQHV
jgi:hypothetical protein